MATLLLTSRYFSSFPFSYCLLSSVALSYSPYSSCISYAALLSSPFLSACITSVYMLAQFCRGQVISGLPFCPMEDEGFLHWYPVSRHRSRSRSNSRGSPAQQQGLFIKEILQSGNSAKFQWSGNWVRVEPVVDHSTLQVGDIVFCQLQSDGPYYLHKINRIFTCTRSVASSHRTGDELAASAPRSGNENVGRMKYDISSPSGVLLGTC